MLVLNGNYSLGKTKCTFLDYFSYNWFILSRRYNGQVNTVIAYE